MLNDFMMSLRDRLCPWPEPEAPDTPPSAFLLSTPPDKPLWLPAPAVIRTITHDHTDRIDFLLALVRQAVVMDSAVVYIDSHCRDRPWRGMRNLAAWTQRAHQVLAQAAPLQPQDDLFACLEQGALLYLGLGQGAPQTSSFALQTQHTLRALRNTFAARRRHALTGRLRPLLLILDDCCAQSGQMAPEVVALAADAPCLGVTMVIGDRVASHDLPELDALVDCHVYQRMDEPEDLPATCRRRLGLRLPVLSELRDLKRGVGVVCLRAEPHEATRRRPARTALPLSHSYINIA